MAKPLTTTSFVLLAHLAQRPWSAFELAGQMREGMDLVWSRAESSIYEEEKNLVAHELAAVWHEASGRRPRAMYRITPKGRRALRDWLGEPSAPPQLESEALVRVLFAEHGDRASLLAAIDSVEVYGRWIRARLRAQRQSYLDDEDLVAGRWHLIGIGSRYLVEFAALQERWARWARDEVARWPESDAEPPPPPDDAEAVSPPG